MTEKRFTSQRTDDYNFSDILDNGKWIGICHVDCEDDFVNKFNELADENEQLKCGNKNLKATLNDFINICNRLQSNPNDKQTLSVARDMLQNMGVDLE